MRSAKNIIDKIFLDFTFKVNGKGSRKATEETREIFYNNLLPKIDSLLSKHSNNSIIRIDSLTIDLDKTTLTDIPDKLLSELESELAKHLPNPLWTKQTKENKANSEEEDLDTLLYFLQTGTLPWHHDKNTSPGKLLINILKKNKIQTQHRLKQAFEKNEITLRRFILQFSEEQVYEIFASFIAENSFKLALTAWYQFVGAKQPGQIQRTFLFAIKHEIIKNEIEFLTDFSEVLILPHLKIDRSVLPEIVSELKTIPKKHILTEKIVTIFREMEKKYSHANTRNDSIQTQRQMANGTPTEEKAVVKEQKKNNDPGITSFTVDNAGLVILFPYIQMFFSEIGLMKDEEFSSPAAQLKAVQMLQYLATGSAKTPEHLLALNKALCGIDMAMPCPGTLRLTKAQKQMCETLLNAVINNWPPLRGTSITGFRQSFLQRNGTLKKEDDNWTLHVERKAFDILLEQLPWGFSVVKFPWTEQFIHVLW
ncbi:contractile injection system tape measure protein [Polluticoccus soli]|uniref:contractile injection system tape measure protein n=1 Tax=Polluticoccus soli TaxID=3034150 RepID=UPI0023E2ED17|nr:contractile injection system tape measure protein [Flavipsychrobacter sp. JY13-12]